MLGYERDEGLSRHAPFITREPRKEKILLRAFSGLLTLHMDSLPVEILVYIGRYVTDYKSIVSFSSCCRYIHNSLISLTRSTRKQYEFQWNSLPSPRHIST